VSKGVPAKAEAVSGREPTKNVSCFREGEIYSGRGTWGIFIEIDATRKRFWGEKRWEVTRRSGGGERRDGKDRE
jgi:hypothetical protein